MAGLVCCLIGIRGFMQPVLALEERPLEKGIGVCNTHLCERGLQNYSDCGTTGAAELRPPVHVLVEPSHGRGPDDGTKRPAEGGLV